MINSYDFPNPIVLGHRGASAYAPENTLASFQTAHDQGADGIELDAKLSKDGQVIVIHDNTYDRTTDASGVIGDKNLSEIKKLDAGSWFSDKYIGEGIPTLSEVLDEFGDKMIINIELANYGTPFDSLPKKVTELLKNHNSSKYRILFSSFMPTNVIKMSHLMPGAALALLTHSNVYGILQCSSIFRWISPEFIHPNKDGVDRQYILKQHKYKRRVHVWTVNLLEEIDDFIQANVDGIITDDPCLAKQIIINNQNDR